MINTHEPEKKIHPLTPIMVINHPLIILWKYSNWNV